MNRLLSAAYEFVVSRRCKKLGIIKHGHCQVSKTCVVNGSLRIEMGNQSRIGAHVFFGGSGRIVIGDNVSIGDYTYLYVSPNGGIEIGNNSILAPFCFVIDSDHDLSLGANVKDTKGLVDKVHIGNGVWIGTHVCILRGSFLADGCCVGAGTVIKGSFDENSIVVGGRAKCLRKRI